MTETLLVEYEGEEARSRYLPPPIREGGGGQVGL